MCELSPYSCRLSESYADARGESKHLESSELWNAEEEAVSSSSDLQQQRLRNCTTSYALDFPHNCLNNRFICLFLKEH